MSTAAWKSRGLSHASPRLDDYSTGVGPFCFITVGSFYVVKTTITATAHRLARTIYAMLTEGRQ
jgi:hypothetical protein